MNYFKEIKKLKERVETLEDLQCRGVENPDKEVKRKKITLKEFFNSKYILYIHCNTREKAVELLEEFDKMGKTWVNRDSYLKYNFWYNCRESTVYSNKGAYLSEDMIINKSSIYEFEDVIFEEPKFTEDEKVILRNLPKEYKYIARDNDGCLWIFMGKPIKRDNYFDNGIYKYDSMFMFKHLFQSIQWEDEEPCEFRKYL